ncbi:DUF6407 family protein [Jeotgalibacillus haloalkalitolerans]|uniref:DUF6407 family protein n=1 Tax=Jeotgalibacillus haloalkalitolerans TaxID=3104292 RepID=A0ABU5KN82_9BACL|nr:DUF6407 family protein [Jeotgalibacillus sp. HH7-29]MDZ5712604.1 DUF6407 family protein [Jeotgalibacillus sp. HH7-29]
MNFEDFVKAYWKGDLYSFVIEAITFYEMDSTIETEEMNKPLSFLYLSSIAEENMLSRLIHIGTEYADIEAAFNGRVIRDY